MRSLVLVALLGLPAGCAHHSQNLAVRKNDKPPRGDFMRTPAQEHGAGVPAEPPPIDTPAVP